MKIIVNNSDVSSKVVFKGEEYSVDAKSISTPVSDEVAEFWFKIHPFLVIQDKTVETKLDKVEIKKEDIKEIIKDKKDK